MVDISRGRRHWHAGEYEQAREVWHHAARRAARSSRECRLLYGLRDAAAAALEARRGRWRAVARYSCRARDLLRNGGMEAFAAAIDAWTRGCVERAAKVGAKRCSAGRDCRPAIRA